RASTSPLTVTTPTPHVTLSLHDALPISLNIPHLPQEPQSIFLRAIRSRGNILTSAIAPWLILLAPRTDAPSRLLPHTAAKKETWCGQELQITPLATQRNPSGLLYTPACIQMARRTLILGLLNLTAILPMSTHPKTWIPISQAG